VARRLWLGVFLIVATSAFLLLSDWKQRTSEASSIPRVAIFQFSSVKLLDDGVRGVMDRLKDNHFDVGRNVLVDRFNSENDMATATSIANEITSGKYGIVVSVSTNCLQAVANANQNGRAKHIFGVVADPTIAKVGVSATDPLDHPKHMIGIGSLMPPAEILAAAVRMNPKVKKFGLPWNPSQANSERFTVLARKAAKEMGLELIEAPVDNTNAVGETVASLIARGSEAILALGDLTVVLAIDSVVSEAKKAKIPVFSSQTDMVPRGALYAAGPDFYYIGRQMGDLLVRVLKGEDTAKIPISYELPKQFAVNLKTLQGLKEGWRIPDDVVAQATTVIR